MAHGAHLRVLARESLGIEARPVRVEATAARRRVTGKAIAFGVTADAGFEALSRGTAVADEEEAVRVMIAATQARTRHETGVDMAAGAEAGRVVAIGA